MTAGRPGNQLYKQFSLSSSCKHTVSAVMSSFGMPGNRVVAVHVRFMSTNRQLEETRIIRTYLRGSSIARSGPGKGTCARFGDARLRFSPQQSLVGLNVLISAAGDDDCRQLVQHKHQLLL